jgi:hypothetical protein
MVRDQTSASIPWLHLQERVFGFMTVLTRAALVDDRTTASNPGGVSVQCFRYVQHFPVWPLGFAVCLTASAAWAALWPSFWWVALLSLVLNVLFWVRVKLRFKFGCVNPSRVVAVSPFTLAVFTDLSTGEGDYPVIKIIRHPLPRGRQYKLGDNCATVAMYTGSADAEHWEDFSPIMVDCATDNRSEIQLVTASIPSEEWADLDEGLKTVSLPLKTGLYPFRRSSVLRTLPKESS